jgi:hypothetical protein
MPIMVLKQQCWVVHPFGGHFQLLLRSSWALTIDMKTIPFNHNYLLAVQTSLIDLIEKGITNK